MKSRLLAIAWGFIGMIVALAIWFLAATAYNDHLLLQQVVNALNSAARQAQQTQQAQPAPAVPPAK